MHWTSRRAAFRALLETEICVHPSSVFDPISARIAKDIGFEVGMFAGSVASLTVLGAPDLIVLTLSEFAEQAYRINRASDLPLMVDADHGYGNALNVKRTVEELETAGVAALTVEDTDLPQPFDSSGSARVLSIDEGVGKMRAALQGRQDCTLVIAGRTSAASINGLEDAIERGQAYQAAGVDAMFFTGISERQEVEALSAALNIPIFLGGTGGGLLGDREYLADRGVRISLQGHQPFMAAVQATYTALKALREGTPPSEISGIAPSDLMQTVTQAAEYQRWIKEYLN
jgi:carboxyvinyl-carboxyphosphonate phosphorylmutase